MLPPLRGDLLKRSKTTRLLGKGSPLHRGLIVKHEGAQFVNGSFQKVQRSEANASKGGKVRCSRTSLC